jgi:hypothetical protein
MRTIIVGFRLSEIEKKLLDKKAKKMGVPLSDAIRWALRRELFAPNVKQLQKRDNKH